MPENWKNPDDIKEGRGVQLSFQYTWNGTSCTINNITWKPGKIIIDENNNRSFSAEALSDTGFT